MSENDESKKEELTSVPQPETQTEVSGGKKKHRMSKKKKAGITIAVIVVLLACIAGAVYYFGHHYYSKTNYVTDEEAKKQIEEQKARQAEAEAEAEVTQEPEEIDPELLEAQQNMAQYASTEPITTDGNVYNVMLVGLDTTKEDYVGNSDSMILISINYRLHQISMISLMRDTLVHIPNVGYRKLNAAYPNGGGPLLTQTVEENYKIDVDRYVTVDFGAMIDIVDEIGTIEITFTEKEAENANKSIKQQCRILGLKSKKYLIPGEGTYECNGMQAVAYARIRKVGNSDYQRTERQREVLMKLLQKVKEMSFEDLDRLATRLLPVLTHNVPESEFWGLLAKAPTLLNYNIIQDRIPYDKMYNSVNGNLVPAWESTARKLKETIYGSDILDEEGNLLTPTPTAGTDSADGSAADGTAADGETTDGTTAAGTTTDGTTADGKTEDGTTADGKTADGTTADGTAAAGQKGTSPTGTAAADGTSNDEETPEVVEPEIGYNDSSAQIVLGTDADGEVKDSLQPEKKAAVVADNVPDGRNSSSSSSSASFASSSSDARKVIAYPYANPVFTLRVPNAPVKESTVLADGEYRWRKNKISSGLKIN